MEVQESGLSNIQLELLNSMLMTWQKMICVPSSFLLARYFADKASDAMDQFSVDNNLLSQDMMA